MSIQHLKFPTIAPVPQGVYRPLWSVTIPTYNCTKYLKTTLLHLLDQALSPELMQIEVVDNCSTEGNPEELVKELGKGRVSFYRQPQNIGLVGNFNTCIERSTGQLVHILHCDDLVLPGFYEALQQGFEQEPTIGAAFCRSVYIDEDDAQIGFSPYSKATSGVFPNLLEWVCRSHLIESPAFVVKRDVYERLGGFHSDLFHACDTELYMRIVSQYSVWYEPASLVSYRKHANSFTSSLIKSATNITNVREAIEVSESYLPKERITDLREFEAINGFRSVCWQLVKLDFDCASKQMKETWNISHSFKTIAKMIVFLAAFLVEGGINRLQRLGLKIFSNFKLNNSHHSPAYEPKSSKNWSDKAKGKEKERI